MLWTATAETTHHHPNRTDDSACAICVVAHTANPTPNCAHTIPFFSTIDFLHDEVVLARAQFDLADAGIRGPPAL